MPKIKDFLPWAKKKGHGPKYANKELHSYPDNMRHAIYQTTSPSLGSHHTNLQQQYQHQTHPHHQLQVPSHSLTHKLHAYPQQIIMQSPQPTAFVPNQQQQQQVQQSPQQLMQHPNQPTRQQQVQQQHQQQINGPINQCSCSQCSSQQHQPIHQHNTMQQQQIHTTQPHQSFTTNPNSLGQQNITQNQPIMSPQHIGQQPHQILQSQHVASPVAIQPQNQHHITLSPPVHQMHHGICQHQQPLQQPNPHCHNQTHNYANQVAHSTSNGISGYQVSPVHQQHQQQMQLQTPQCVCAHQCSYQQGTNSVSHQVDYSQTNGHSNGNNCQHQVVANYQQVVPQSHTVAAHQTLQSNVNQSFVQPQINPPAQQIIQAPVVLSSPAPNYSQHQLQQQSDPMVSQQNAPHHRYNTIQPNQYPLTKQNFVQQQHQHQQAAQTQHQHHRVHSLHQQQYEQQQRIGQQHFSPQSVQTQTLSQSQMQIPAYQNNQPLEQPPYNNIQESNFNDSSRYVNMPLRCDLTKSSSQKPIVTINSSQSAKFEDHVYCNHNQKLILPPYKAPPDYDTFMENRKMFDSALATNDDHLTCHSESLLMQRFKDSGYENLRDTCLNFEYKQEVGFTS